jgi:F0F1-type ATP synthase membrane subunit c/vacuolar-type H+-ATPase subunit K
MTENLRPHRGVMLLVLGIAALVTCPLVGIAPWIMGRNDLRAIERGEVDPEGRQLTQAGMALGIVGVAMTAFYGFLVGAVLLFSVASRVTR